MVLWLLALEVDTEQEYFDYTSFKNTTTIYLLVSIALNIIKS